jgi:hypothetical protein
MRVKSWAIKGRELEWYVPVASIGREMERKQEQTGTAAVLCFSVFGWRFIKYVLRFGSWLASSN